MMMMSMEETNRTDQRLQHSYMIHNWQLPIKDGECFHYPPDLHNKNSNNNRIDERQQCRDQCNNISTTCWIYGTTSVFDE